MCLPPFFFIPPLKDLFTWENGTKQGQMLLETECGECCKEVQSMSSGEEKSYLLGVTGKGFIKDKQGRFQKAVHSRQRKQPTPGLGGETRLEQPRSMFTDWSGSRR